MEQNLIHFLNFNISSQVDAGVDVLVFSLVDSLDRHRCPVKKKSHSVAEYYNKCTTFHRNQYLGLDWFCKAEKNAPFSEQQYPTQKPLDLLLCLSLLLDMWTTKFLYILYPITILNCHLLLINTLPFMIKDNRVYCIVHDVSMVEQYMVHCSM